MKRDMETLLHETQERLKALERRMVRRGGGGGGYQLGQIYAWASDVEPASGRFLNGQTIVGGATSLSGIAALYPSWVDGDDLVLPDWGGHTPVGYKAGDDTFFTLGAMLGSKTHNHSLTPGTAYAHVELGSDINMREVSVPGWVRTNRASVGGTSQGGYTATDAAGVDGDTDSASTVQPSVVVNWVVCVATSSGDFDTEVQTALVSNVSGLLALEPRLARGVIPSSVVVGSGSASVADDGTVTLTNVSSVSLNDIFDGLGMDDYEIRYVVYNTSETLSLSLRLRAAGVDNSAAVYDQQNFFASVSAPSASTTIGGTSLGLGIGSRSRVMGDIDIVGPARSDVTLMRMSAGTMNANGLNSGYILRGAVHDSTSVFTGVTIFSSGGTVNGALKVVKRG